MIYITPRTSAGLRFCCYQPQYIIPSREGTAGEGGTLMQVPGVFFQQRQGNMFEGGRVGGGQ